eukprot:6610598-Pyramimonas_sp.AAC.1
MLSDVATRILERSSTSALVRNGTPKAGNQICGFPRSTSQGIRRYPEFQETSGLDAYNGWIYSSPTEACESHNDDDGRSNLRDRRACATGQGSTEWDSMRSPLSARRHRHRHHRRSVIPVNCNLNLSEDCIHLRAKRVLTNSPVTPTKRIAKVTYSTLRLHSPVMTIHGDSCLEYAASSPNACCCTLAVCGGHRGAVPPRGAAAAPPRAQPAGRL